MKKVMTVGMAVLMAAGIAGAQNEVVMVELAPANDASRPEVTSESALVSSYVWRGQVYNNDFVMQPQLTISQYDISFNVWGNVDVAGSSSSGVSSDFSEIDFSLAYTLPIAINEVAIDVGAIHYTYPNTTDSSTGKAAESTSELFISATALSWVDHTVAFIPSVTMFGDIDEVNGTYFLFDVVFPYEVSEYLFVEGGISAGYGNTSYNTYYWEESAGAGWNDYNVYGNASYEIKEGLTASLNLTYTMLEGGDVRDGASEKYDNDKKFWGGVNIAYDF